jgi:hypothetical protein
MSIVTAFEALRAERPEIYDPNGKWARDGAHVVAGASTCEPAVVMMNVLSLLALSRYRLFSNCWQDAREVLHQAWELLEKLEQHPDGKGVSQSQLQGLRTQCQAALAETDALEEAQRLRALMKPDTTKTDEAEAEAEEEAEANAWKAQGEWTPAKRKREARCGTCAGCCAEECGTCSSCLDMVKRGGAGKLHQACKARKCVGADAVPAPSAPPAPSAAPAPSAVPAASAPTNEAESVSGATDEGAAGVDLELVQGLSQLVKNLSEPVQAAALAWCLQQEVSAVGLIVECEEEENFLQALPMQPHGLPAKALRKRLAAVRS